MVYLRPYLLQLNPASRVTKYIRCSNDRSEMTPIFKLIYEGHSVFFCPFAFKARSTTVIFVISITSHQTSLLDDVHKVLAVFIGHKLCFWNVFSVPFIYWNTTDLVLHWHCNYLPENNTCGLKIIRTHMVQDIVIIIICGSSKTLSPVRARGVMSTMFTSVSPAWS